MNIEQALQDNEIPTVEFNAIISTLVKQNLEERSEKVKVLERVVGIVKGE